MSWYIIYTKQGNEKKVASVLTKKKIENLFPLNSKTVKSLRKIKVNQEPLFPSYVFVKTDECNLERIKSISGVINFVYWKGRPAIVTDDEVNAIKDFVADYNEVKVEKTVIDPFNTITIEQPQFYMLEGNLLAIKKLITKVSLPSIGFTLVAPLPTENRLVSSDITTRNERLLLQ